MSDPYFELAPSELADLAYLYSLRDSADEAPTEAPPMPSRHDDPAGTTDEVTRSDESLPLENGRPAKETVEENAPAPESPDVTKSDDLLHLANALVQARAVTSEDVTNSDDPLPFSNELVRRSATGPTSLTTGNSAFPTPHSLPLSQRQQTAIELLLAGEPEGKVAETIGIHRMTLWRWKQNRHFRAALETARELAFGAWTDQLRSLAPRAIDDLEARLEAGDPMAATRILRLIRIDREPPQRGDRNA